MFKNTPDEADNVEEHITYIMYSMCQECRFLAAAKVIDSIDKDFIGELLQYAQDRLEDTQSDPWSAPINEPKHRGGGCYVRI